MEQWLELSLLVDLVHEVSGSNLDWGKLAGICTSEQMSEVDLATSVDQIPNRSST